MCSPMAHFACRMVMAVSVFIAFDDAKVLRLYSNDFVSFGVFTRQKKQPIKTLCFNGLRIVVELV